MKTTNIIITVIIALVFVSCGYKGKTSLNSTHQGRKFLPEQTQLIHSTPIKNLSGSELSWAYGMLGTIESEHIMKGDSINISIAYVVRKLLQEKALEYFFSQGKRDIDLRGMASMLIHYINRYGAQPYDSYEDPKDINYKVLCRKVQGICDSAAKHKKGINQLRTELDELFDREIGYMPAKVVHMLGAEYTPCEFAHSICYPEEYVALTSFSHHPFREYISLEVPNNMMHDVFLNLPIDDLMQHIQHAIENGHPVCWEGDITEPGFNAQDNYLINIQPEEHPVTQASRQKEFEQLETTDDHVMEITGTFIYNKVRYYVCRNSWGTNWGDQGFIYLSEDYIRLKTIAVYMSEEAYIPRNG